jgi:hypothetical protein
VGLEPFEARTYGETVLYFCLGPADGTAEGADDGPDDGAADSAG